jgi:hypothetical protein
MTRVSTSGNDTLALHRTVPTQSPIALLQEMHSVRPYYPQLRTHPCWAFRPIWTLALQFAPVIVFSHITATAQIAIVHRHC